MMFAEDRCQTPASARADGRGVAAEGVSLGKKGVTHLTKRALHWP